MDVHSLCTLRASGFIWQPGPGTFAQTVIVKATFQLEPGQSTLAGDQEAINEDDNYWNDDPSRSIVAPSDWAPFKPKADIMLVGHAFAPGGIPTRALTARILIGEIDKSIEVWCDRGFRIADGQLLEGPRFSKMPLRWERTAGGPGTSNPVGMRFDAPPDKYGMVAVPNLQPLGMYVSKRSDTFAPVGYGPIAADWPSRMTKLGRLGAGFFARGRGWESRPLPEGVDYAYFQAAPTDQQTGELRAAERLVLENLHPEHARLVTNLPGIKPRVIAERGNGAREEMGLMTDTLWIDTDRGLCTLVWRGRISLRDAAEPGRIVVSMEEEAPVSLELELEDELEPTKQPKGRAQAADLSAVTIVPGTSAQAMVGAALPFAGNARPSISEGERRAAGGDSVLPFGRGGVSGQERMNTLLKSPIPVTGSETFGLAEVPPPAPVAPPAIVMPKASASAAESTGAGMSPWARGGEGVPKETTPAPAMRSPQQDPAAGASVSAVGASNAAVAAAAAWSPAAPWTAKQRHAPILDEQPAEETVGKRELVDLIWFDPASVARIRRVPAWRELLVELGRQPKSQRYEIADAGQEPWEAEDRRDVLEILAKGACTDLEGIKEAMEQGIGEDGKYIAPMVMVKGELEIPFEEMAALRAGMSTAVPLIKPADEDLKASVGVAKDFLGTPGLLASPAVCEGLLGRIREAFLKEKKGMPEGYFDGQIERALLPERKYQKRKVFGGTYLRCWLWMPGEKDALVVYLAEEAGERLPMYKRFGVKVVAEVHPRKDQWEARGEALRGVGVSKID